VGQEKEGESNSIVYIYFGSLQTGLRLVIAFGDCVWWCFIVFGVMVFSLWKNEMHKLQAAAASRTKVLPIVFLQERYQLYHLQVTI